MSEALPLKFEELVAELESVDSDTRADILIELADGFTPVSEETAVAPFPETARIPGCESEVFAFSTATKNSQDSSCQDFHFAVENPQGISAMAMASIIQETLNGVPSEEIQAIPHEVTYRIFGKTLSMGKGQGLMNMIGVVKALARSSCES